MNNSEQSSLLKTRDAYYFSHTERCENTSHMNKLNTTYEHITSHTANFIEITKFQNNVGCLEFQNNDHMFKAFTILTVIDDFHGVICHLPTVTYRVQSGLICFDFVSADQPLNLGKIIDSLHPIGMI